jgi:hypothetical protein
MMCFSQNQPALLAVKLDTYEAWRLIAKKQTGKGLVVVRYPQLTDNKSDDACYCHAQRRSKESEAHEQIAMSAPWHEG